MTKRKNVFLMTDLGLKGLRDELLCHFLFYRTAIFWNTKNTSMTHRKESLTCCREFFIIDIVCELALSYLPPV